MSLVEFLLARVAEDEAVAQERPQGEFIHLSGCYYYEHTLDVGWFCDCDEDGAGTRRLLAECEAKRRILSAYEQAHRQMIAADNDPACTNLDRSRFSGEYVAWHAAVIWAAIPYRDHPDYDPDWAA